MKATSSAYVTLQKVYKQKAREDLELVKQLLAETLETVGLGAVSSNVGGGGGGGSVGIREEEVESFVKHAAWLKVIRGRSLRQEYEACKFAGQIGESFFFFSARRVSPPPPPHLERERGPEEHMLSFPTPLHSTPLRFQALSSLPPRSKNLPTSLFTSTPHCAPRPSSTPPMHPIVVCPEQLPQKETRLTSAKRTRKS